MRGHERRAVTDQPVRRGQLHGAAPGLPTHRKAAPGGRPDAVGITTCLDNGGTIEKAQTIAAHASPRTTKLYDRTGDEITLDEVERIVI